MKKILLVLFLVFSSYGFAQELFLYEFDKNVSLDFPEYGEEHESEFIRYTNATIADEGIVMIMKTNIGSSLFPAKDRNFDKFCQGIKQGVLNKTKGKAIEEARLEIDNVKVFNLVVSMEIENNVKIMESYNFIREDFTYMIQFMSPEIQSDAFKSIKERIVNSITIQD